MDQTQSPHCKHKQIILEINYSIYQDIHRKAMDLKFKIISTENLSIKMQHSSINILISLLLLFTNDFIPNFDAMHSLNIQSMLSLTVNHIPKSYK